MAARLMAERERCALPLERFPPATPPLVVSRQDLLRAAEPSAPRKFAQSGGVGREKRSSPRAAGFGDPLRRC
ncbi:hypothetical protein GUJ93_ZPchr0007g6315 [Zizania palustris]|uniref:Uncharacterized protein n=1 Tax=Zizania palustris TaxID=103762 RepID=A0A8J5W435_ZIZPA|nr:hypothetical protein GUJ93_ZPchr0007g6315 [Zizania palustris]